MAYTDKQKIEFLESLVKEFYSQGDSYYAYKSKKNIWHFGYENDYELQHGKGVNVMMPDGMVVILMIREE